MDNVLYLIMIILSVILIFVILLQTKGSSFSGAFGGDTGSIYRTRRGFEKTLFQSTIALAVIWAIFAAISSIAN
jgi:preprotein translocase subunit SecG